MSVIEAVAAMALAAAVVVAAAASVVAGRVPIPAAQRAGMMPFRLATAGRAAASATWDVLWWDGVAQFYAWRWVLRDALKQGELPLWSPWAFCGQPLAANAQSACFYPPAAIICRLVPAAQALGWLWVFHVALAIFLAWGLTRRLGGGHLGGVVAGTIYSTGGFMLAWTPVPSLMQSAAWLPGVLWGIEAALHSSRWLGSLGLAVCLAAAVLAGHMQVAGYVWLVGAAWAAGRLALRAARQKPAPIGTVALGFALGLALAAPQWMPTIELGKLSPRGYQKPTAQGFAFAKALALKPYHLITALWPLALGTPKHGTFPGFAFAEHFAGIGPAALVLAAAALWWRRSTKWTWVMVGLAVASLWLASGGLPARLVYFYIPFLGQTGGFQRTLFIFCLAAAVLAGLGADGLMADDGRPGGGTYGESRGGTKHIVVGIIVAVAIGLQAVWLVAAVLPLDNAADLRTSDPVSEWLRARVGPEARVLAVTPRDRWTLRPRPRAIYPPNTLTPLGVADIQGYDSLYPAVCKAALAAVEGCDPSPPTNGNMILLENAGAPTIGRMAVEYVLSTEALGSPRLEKLVEFGGAGETVRIYRHKNFTPRWRTVHRDRAVRFVAGRYNKMSLAVAPGTQDTLVLADTPYPGWRAFVDGQQVDWRPAHGVLGREVEVPSARREVIVQFVFWPSSIVVGLFAGLSGIVVLAAVGSAVIGK